MAGRLVGNLEASPGRLPPCGDPCSETWPPRVQLAESSTKQRAMKHDLYPEFSRSPKKIRAQCTLHSRKLSKAFHMPAHLSSASDILKAMSICERARRIRRSFEKAVRKC